MFNLASDLEGVCINLTQVEDLLNILLSGVFEKQCEISDYVQQYETLVVMALVTLHNQERKAREISDTLYEINKQIKEQKGA